MLSSLKTTAKQIQLLILDVDGVLTDGKIHVTDSGEETLSFHVHDGYGIVRLREIPIPIAIISGRNTPAMSHRFKKLKIEHLFLGQPEKMTAFHSLLNKLDITPDAVAYVGDDLLDIPVMELVGLPIAVANAMPAVKKIAKGCTQNNGGDGAVREVCDLIYAAHHP